MINLATLEKTSDNFAYQRMLFKKRDFAYILNREKISTKLNDFLTRAYYQRQRLIAEGFIGLAYTYRINLSMGNNKNHRTFALFAPFSWIVGLVLSAWLYKSFMRQDSLPKAPLQQANTA